jgi:UDP-GlcNAc:undecaprenyl-phosphate GlcNAc-1-phosphate transferase
MVFAIGVYDDLRGCSAWPKLAVEAVAGTILFFSGVKIGDFGLHGRPGTLACYGLTLCLVIAVTNGFNLIDGMDGLAAGSAALSTMAIAVIGLMNHSGAAVLLAVALAGALVGFLRFNFSPASIFLGDGGSLFIGFTLSAAAMLAVQNMRTSQTVITPALVFAIPVLEVCVSVLRRRLRGRSIFCADRDHFHHRLLLRGFSHRQAVIALYGASAVSALLGLLLLYCAARARVPVLISFLACTAVLIRWLKYEELCQFPLSLLAARSRRPRWVDMHGSLSRTV